MTKEVLNYFRNIYFDKYEQNYPTSWGRDMATIKRLLKYYDAETLKQFIDGYFKISDPFVVNAGHPLTLMQSQIPKIVARQRVASKETITSTTDAEIIERARNSGNTNEDF